MVFFPAIGIVTAIAHPRTSSLVQIARTAIGAVRASGREMSLDLH
jgi:hypothetical protein